MRWRGFCGEESAERDPILRVEWQKIFAEMAGYMVGVNRGGEW